MDLVAVGRRVRHLREQRGLSQPALAARAKLHINTISKIERGLCRSIKTRSLDGIAGVLGVSVVDLLTAANNAARRPRRARA